VPPSPPIKVDQSPDEEKPASALLRSQRKRKDDTQSPAAKRPKTSKLKTSPSKMTPPPAAIDPLPLGTPLRRKLTVQIPKVDIAAMNKQEKVS
jgi:hypothetical protein